MIGAIKGCGGRCGCMYAYLAVRSSTRRDPEHNGGSECRERSLARRRHVVGPPTTNTRVGTTFSARCCWVGGVRERARRPRRRPPRVRVYGTVCVSLHTSAMAPPKKPVKTTAPLRILCLHGSRQTGQIFSDRVSRLCSKLRALKLDLLKLPALKRISFKLRFSKLILLKLNLLKRNWLKLKLLKPHSLKVLLLKLISLIS